MALAARGHACPLLRQWRLGRPGAAAQRRAHREWRVGVRGSPAAGRCSRSRRSSWSIPPWLLRAIEVYEEVERLDFAEAYLVAAAKRSGVGQVASFDRSIDRVTTVERIEP